MPNKIQIKTVHPWRPCPYGMHWVAEFKRKVKVSAKNPSGQTIVGAHCRKNLSRKDQLYRDEIEKIANDQFAKLTGSPKTDSLDFEKQNPDQFDIYIRGWVKYWNDIFRPSNPLDPNLVKALIATESSFRPKSKVKASKNNFARGLMQVTDQTLKILGDEKGELLDSYLTLTRDDMFIPNLNICAGVRWLFRKQQTATSRLKKEATWMETVAEYKSYLKDMIKDPDYSPKGVRDTEIFFKRLTTP